MRTAPDVHDTDRDDGGTAGNGADGPRTDPTHAPPGRRGGVAVVDRDTGSARRRREARGPVPADPDPDGGDGEDPDWTVGEADGAPPVAARRPRGGSGRRWRRALPWGLAVLGLVGTVVFGHAWASQNARAGQEAQVRTVSGDFLLALTNFDAKNVDADFTRIQGYATGDFAKQSNQFFGSAIRTQLEAALASSRGQLRSQYVQSLHGSQASVYSVVDQTYVNNKMQSPAADELQIVTDLTDVGGTWKVADVTVLNNGGGASASGGTAGGVGTTGGTKGTSTSTTVRGG